VSLLAADIGGTFTDLILQLPDGTLSAHKVLSTPRDYSDAVIEGGTTLLRARGEQASSVHELCHGTTLGTNAVLERQGALTALITTRGFRDVLEIRRIRFPEPYNVQWDKPAPLVPRRLRFEITERIGSNGEIVTSPDPAEVAELAGQLAASEVTSIAIALINSYANPAHEEWLAAQLETLLPGCSVTVSSRLLPEMGEYERTSTAVANAYLAPIMETYMARLRQRLDDAGISAPVLVGQSNGGLFLHTFAMRKPYLTLESGPAAGCVAAQQVARRAGFSQLLAVDMGGTTTKASFLSDGHVSWASEFEVGSAMSQASRLLNGGGYAVRCPIIDLVEVGAGGGSIAQLDSGGLLRVGPRSAGASPGPACYDLGGQEPTLTDANVVLGYINPASLAGGTFTLNAALACTAVSRIAQGLGQSVEDAAFGIHRIANSNMTFAIRAVSTQRGRDVRQVDMLAFGGSGPLQAVGLADSLGLRRVIVPPLPGLFSSLGLLIADVEHHLMRGFVAPMVDVDPDVLNATLAAMEIEVASELREAGYGQQVTIERMAALKIITRSGEVLLNLPNGRLGAHDLVDLERRFQEAYREVYRYVPRDAGAELLNLRVIGRVARHASWPTFDFTSSSPDPTPGERRAYFGPTTGWLTTRVLSRGQLGENHSERGPLLIEEADSTTVVHPGWRARRDRYGNIIVER
jgi:N-methylhydantoinase A